MAADIDRLVSTNRLAAAGSWSYVDVRPLLSGWLQQLLPLASSNRLCILGAGSINDIDLQPLADSVSRVALVDIDPAALELAEKRALASGLADVSVHCLDLLQPLPGQLDSTLRNDLTTFHVTLSALCLADMVADALDQSVAPAETVRSHILDVARLTHPAGVMAIASDVISSQAEPIIGAQRPEQHATTLRRLAADGRCFVGLNPFVLVRDMARAAASGTCGLAGPWAWRPHAHDVRLVVGAWASREAVLSPPQ